MDSSAYFAHPDLGREGILWLVEQGVKVIGIDAYTRKKQVRAPVESGWRLGQELSWHAVPERAQPLSSIRLPRKKELPHALDNLDRPRSQHGPAGACG